MVEAWAWQLGMGLRYGLEDGLGLRHGLEAWGREGWLGLRHGGGGQGLSYGREGWPGLNNGKKRYSVRLENKSQKYLKKSLISSLRSEMSGFLRLVFQVLSTISLFPIV